MCREDTVGGLTDEQKKGRELVQFFFQMQLRKEHTGLMEDFGGLSMRRG